MEHAITSISSVLSVAKELEVGTYVARPSFVRAVGWKVGAGCMREVVVEVAVVERAEARKTGVVMNAVVKNLQGRSVVTRGSCDEDEGAAR